MDIQEIIILVALGLAVTFLYRKFFGKSKKKNCGTGNDCGCS